MRAVNLLPRETSTRKFGWNSELAAAGAFTLLMVVIVVGGFALERSHAATAQQRLAAAQTALDSANSQPSAKQTQLQVPAVVSQEQPWHLALDSALATRVSWDVLLSQFEYVVPPKVDLTSVSFGSPAGSVAVAGTTGATVALGGNAFSLHDVAVFLSTLARVPKLSQITLVSTASNTNSNVMTFQITAQVALPAAPVAPAGTSGTTTTTTGGQA
ncbi:MAG TPA: PilN domain-containing protein [Gaiellaceae bacterium]|nr:PilN domain-containing protein [Gaiellaceae bacterium]